MSNPEHDFIRKFVHDAAAIVLDDGKDYLIDSRLQPLCRSKDLPNLAAMVRELRKSPSGKLAQEVIEALTTNETSFYRDINYYDALRQTVIPEIVERQRLKRRVDIWCAASSTGQEPYTLAMLLSDEPQLRGWDVRILATDIDEQVLERARAGVYSQREVNRGLPAPQLVKHFERDGKDWRVKKHLSDMVRFEKLNLARPWPRMDTMDLILIRNVLIYFDTKTKKDILTRANRILRRGGYLLLGGAETTIHLTEAFDPVRVGRAVMYKSAA